VECATYAREGLTPGSTLEGPVIVEQLDSTTVVLPGQRATADRAGNLVIRRSGPARGEVDRRASARRRGAR